MPNVIEMPKLSDTMSVGTLVTWLKKEGDEISSGDMIAEVETDKATMEVECFDDGVMLKHYVKEGEEVPIGAAICAVGEKGEEAPSAEDVGSGNQAAQAEKDSRPEEDEDGEPEPVTDEESSEPAYENEEKPEPTPARDSADSEAPPPPSTTDGGRVKASPLARKMAADRGLDLASVQGSGPGGRIVKADVEAAGSGGAPSTAKTRPTQAPAPAASVISASGSGVSLASEEEVIKVSNMRKSIAKALVKSVTEAPHFYLQMEIDAGPLNRFRQDLNGKLAELPPEQGGIKFSVNDLILKAAAEAVRRVPEINRSWMGDTIVRHPSVELGVAVAVPDGLVTPVIRKAETKTLRQISAETRELAGKARSKKLKPDEMSGSTLTVSNLGMFGISDFYGIINPPNAAILSVGATIKTPVVLPDDSIGIGYRMKVGLSGDHRVIDGAVGAQYLAALREILETPALMLV